MIVLNASVIQGGGGGQTHLGLATYYSAGPFTINQNNTQAKIELY